MTMDLSSDLHTPDFSHLTSRDFQHVYEPAEDTFLLLDCLQKEASFLQKLRPTVCIEVGSGSGVVITALSQLLKNSAYFIATDRNPHAAICTQETSKQNGCLVNVLNCDLLSPIQHKLQGSVDVLIFNPPYVVTPSDEITSSGIEASWAGGVDGREVTDRLLPLVPDLLSSKGVFYLIVIKENRPDDLTAWMAEMGLDSEIVLQRRAGPEHLAVIKFFKFPGR